MRGGVNEGTGGQMSRLAIWAGMAGLAALLSGCQWPEHWQMTDAELKRGYAKVAPPRPDTPAVYCYKTLADPECLPVFLPGQEYRLVSYYGPAPYVIHVPSAQQIIFQD
jgi:hypothetical protein